MEVIEGTFKVAGMTCENCITRIAVTVERLPGVWWACGDLATGIFRIAYDTAQVKVEAIVQAIEQAGKEGAWRHTYQAEALARPVQRFGEDVRDANLPQLHQRGVARIESNQDDAKH